MNEKGWSLKDFIIIIGIIFGTLLIAVSLWKVTFSSIFKRNSKPAEINNKEEQTINYENLESKLKTAAIKYQNDNYQGNLESKETWVLTYELLRKENYLKDRIFDIQDNKTECTGYVVFEKDGSKFTYTPFLKCGSNYKTNDYNSNNE